MSKLNLFQMPAAVPPTSAIERDGFSPYEIRNRLYKAARFAAALHACQVSSRKVLAFTASQWEMLAKGLEGEHAEPINAGRDHDPARDARAGRREVRPHRRAGMKQLCRNLSNPEWWKDTIAFWGVVAILWGLLLFEIPNEVAR
jgi:hypothetical protein